jgi:ABC-type Co2+ transport system permease subunit
MAWIQLLKVSFILGLALYITYILTAIALSFVMPFLPLGFLGVWATLVEIILTIIAMGLVGAVVLRYVL